MKYVKLFEQWKAVNEITIPSAEGLKITPDAIIKMTISQFLKLEPKQQRNLISFLLGGSKFIIKDDFTIESKDNKEITGKDGRFKIIFGKDVKGLKMPAESESLSELPIRIGTEEGGLFSDQTLSNTMKKFNNLVSKYNYNNFMENFIADFHIKRDGEKIPEENIVAKKEWPQNVEGLFPSMP